MRRRWLVVLAVTAGLAGQAAGKAASLDALCLLREGETRQVNALWGENPEQRQFGQGRSKVVIADLQGPGVITMIHFALPQAMKLDRDAVLRIWWDGERQPSVQAPLTDFFCDPNGALERVETALTNKKRGWNCYFPMPFARRARVEVENDNPRYPSGSWSANPCYSYVICRKLKALPPDAGYFHAAWHQQTLLLGKEDYPVFAAQGRGQFVGWNCTIRGVGGPQQGYPVDENVNFYLDGEREPSIEWQGLEDAFGFSWGFPEQANGFTYTGYQPYYQYGAAAYRFTVSDCISFGRSLRMTVGFGAREAAFFREMFSQPGNPLQLSSVAYWYQREPHQAFAALPPSRQRRPAFYPPTDSEAAQRHREAGETVVLYCGRMPAEEEFLEQGWDFTFRRGYAFQGAPWTTEVNHCWADYECLEFDLVCPPGIAGTLHLLLVDGDNFAGGRRQAVMVAGRDLGAFEQFHAGRQISVPLTAWDTATGRIPVVMKNLQPGGNAVVSIVRFELSKPKEQP